jgi:hypothetical protein
MLYTRGQILRVCVCGEEALDVDLHLYTEQGAQVVGDIEYHFSKWKLR